MNPCSPSRNPSCKIYILTKKIIGRNNISVSLDCFPLLNNSIAAREV